jgi:co-chaperonin GroES (HSP10)
MRLKRGILVVLPDQKNRDESVVAIGPKVKELKVGDTIRKFPLPGIPYTEDGVDYLILSEGSENQGEQIYRI